jgi:glucose-1-phosphate thymidylyltransferase
MNTNWVFGYRVSNPEDYGVVDFEKRDDSYSGKVKVNGIEEKPYEPKSHYAVPGLYFYDNTAVQRARSLKPSSRGELEITDLNNSYIEDGKLNVKILRDNAAWFDTGNPDAMFEAAMFIKSIQSRTGQLIGCIEEVAYKMRLINKLEFSDLMREMPFCQYKQYLQDKYEATVYI